MILPDLLLLLLLTGGTQPGAPSAAHRPAHPPPSEPPPRTGLPADGTPPDPESPARPVRTDSPGSPSEPGRTETSTAPNGSNTPSVPNRTDTDFILEALRTETRPEPNVTDTDSPSDPNTTVTRPPSVPNRRETDPPSVLNRRETDPPSVLNRTESDVFVSENLYRTDDVGTERQTSSASSVTQKSVTRRHVSKRTPRMDTTYVSAFTKGGDHTPLSVTNHTNGSDVPQSPTPSATRMEETGAATKNSGNRTHPPGGATQASVSRAKDSGNTTQRSVTMMRDFSTETLEVNKTDSEPPASITYPLQTPAYTMTTYPPPTSQQTSESSAPFTTSDVRGTNLPPGESTFISSSPPPTNSSLPSSPSSSRGGPGTPVNQSAAEVSPSSPFSLASTFPSEASSGFTSTKSSVFQTTLPPSPDLHSSSSFPPSSHSTSSSEDNMGTSTSYKTSPPPSRAEPTSGPHNSSTPSFRGPDTTETSQGFLDETSTALEHLVTTSRSIPETQTSVPGGTPRAAITTTEVTTPPAQPTNLIPLSTSKIPPMPSSNFTTQGSPPDIPETTRPGGLVLTTGDPSKPATIGDPSRPATTGDPSRPATTGDPSRPVTTDDPSRLVTTNDPSRLVTTDDPSRLVTTIRTTSMDMKTVMPKVETTTGKKILTTTTALPGRLSPTSTGPPATASTSSATLTAPANVCTPNPCHNGGSCVQRGGHQRSFRCECPPAWQGQRCDTDVDECLSKPCPEHATCMNHRGSFTCRCPPGYLMMEKGTSCVQVRTFLGHIEIPRSFLNGSNGKYSKLQQIEAEIVQILNSSFSVIGGYYQSSVTNSSFSRLIELSVQNIFLLSANVTLSDLRHHIQRYKTGCLGAPQPPPACRLILHSELYYRAVSLCQVRDPGCDNETSECSDPSGVTACQCKAGYFQYSASDRSCRACDDGYKLQDGACVRCLFGFGGFNCSNPYQLITVIISAAGGGLLLILGIALAVTCCRKNKHDISKLIFKSGDFQMSPYAEYPKSLRSSDWGRETIEMQENGSTKNLLQMTDVYYAPGLRNPELERNGLFPYSGLPGARHSCIYPGQYNPTFVTEDNRRRDYF